MSLKRVGGTVATVVTALALTGGAYGDPGKSPNGAPGPAGNPNQPAAVPQANAPQGPAANGGGSKGAAQRAAHSKAPAHATKPAHPGKPAHPAAPSHSAAPAHPAHPAAPSHPSRSHANPAPGTPRTGGRQDRPAGKITICHATKSVTNPYVEITISVNGLHGHGPANDPRHHAGSWKDIIPAPAGGCPATVPAAQQTPGTQEGSSQQPDVPAPAAGAQPQSGDVAALVVKPEVATGLPGAQEVLGARSSGTTPATGASRVLGAQASGTNAPKAALATRNADAHGGSLPFTGFGLAVVLIAAAAALLGGFALRRATVHGRS